MGEVGIDDSSTADPLTVFYLLHLLLPNVKSFSDKG